MSDTIVVVIDKKTGATQVHDTDTQTATTSTGAPVPYNSDLAQMFGHPATTDDKGAWWNQPQTGEKEARQTLGPGEHDLLGGSVRRIIELSGPGAYAFHIKSEKAGPLRLQLAGKTSGHIQGGTALVVSGEQDKFMEGALDAFDYTTRALKVGEVVTLNLRYDGGDSTALFVINPQ